MAKAMKCDRCNNFYEYYNTDIEDGPNGIQVFGRDYRDNIYNLNSGRFDLCINCLKEFETWMNVKDKKIDVKIEKLKTEKKK